jgi:ferric-dicitrate binding protein FerR (iron transport regulator)
VALHEAAVRRSRLAGIRKRDDGGKASGPAQPTAWSKVAATSAERRAGAGAQDEGTARARAAGHIKQMTKTTPWYVRAGAGVVLISVVAGILGFFARSGEKGRLQRQISAAVKDVKTGTGQRGNVTLDDGSKAMFGAETRVTIPEQFNELARGVGLIGVAEFTPKQEALPFQVLANNVMLTSSGAETFAVRYFQGDPGVIVRVKQGTIRVEVQEPNESTQTLTAGQTLMIMPDGSTTQPTEAQLGEAFGYIDGTFAVDNKSLKTTLAEIKRWYGTELFLEDTTMGSRMVSMSAPLTSTTDAIKAVETASGLVFGWEGQTMVLKEPKATGRGK